jgi:heme exporter protein D
MATVTYDNNKNYQSLINDAVSSGDMRAAAQFEQLRNEKIAGEGITNYQTTNNYSSYRPTASDTDGTSSQAASGSGSTSAVATTYIDPSGNTQTGYFINGETYKDPYGNQRIESGSMVDTAGGVYQMTDMGSLKIGESGTLTAYLNSGKYTPAASDAGGSAAYSYQNPYSYSSYDDFYSKNGYGSLTTAQQAAVDAYVQQALNSIEAQKKTVNEDSDEMARQAYISYMQSKNALPQQLGAAGYNGGMADSQLLALETGLQNNQNDIAKNRASSLYSLDSAATDAKLQGSIQAAQQQAAVAEAAINAWNN